MGRGDAIGGERWRGLLPFLATAPIVAVAILGRPPDDRAHLEQLRAVIEGRAPAMPIHTVEDFEWANAVAHCQWWARCRGGTRDLSACMHHWLRDGGSSERHMAAAVRWGQAIYDPPAAQRYLEDLAHRSCETWAPTPWSRGVVQGTLLEGGHCGPSYTCRSGLLCVPVDGQRQCVRTVALGAACDGRHPCEEGRCDARSRQCVASLRNGEACDRSAFCQEGLCHEGTCQPWPAPGASCASGDDDSCAPGERCSADGVCRPRPDVGEACQPPGGETSVTWRDDCRSGSACVADGLGRTTGTCRAEGAEGEACDPHERACAGNLQCTPSGGGALCWSSEVPPWAPSVVRRAYGKGREVMGLGLGW